MLCTVCYQRHSNPGNSLIIGLSFHFIYLLLTCSTVVKLYFNQMTSCTFRQRLFGKAFTITHLALGRRKHMFKNSSKKAFSSRLMSLLIWAEKAFSKHFLSLSFYDNILTLLATLSGSRKWRNWLQGATKKPKWGAF